MIFFYETKIKGLAVKKILLFSEEITGFLGKYIVNLFKKKHTEIDVYFFTSEVDKEFLNLPNLMIDSKEKYKYLSGHYAYYTALFDYAEKNSIDHVHLIRLSQPEIFYFEIESRRNFSIEISFGLFGLPDAHKSKMRSLSYFYLFNHYLVKNIFIHSIASSDLVLPDNMIGLLCKQEILNKLVLVSDPIYDDWSFESFSNETLNSMHLNTFNLLFFGAAFYGKGLDILLQATANLDSSYKVFIRTRLNSSNYDFDFQNAFCSPLIDFKDGFINENEVFSIFQKSHVVVLPYRNSYMYDTSGVLVQAALAKRLIIAPNVYPFNYVIQRYNLGLLFEPENSNSLKLVILELKKNYYFFYKNALFDKFIDSASAWSVISDKLFGSSLNLSEFSYIKNN